MFSCQHQRYIGYILLAQTEKELQNLLHDRNDNRVQIPKFNLVLLLSGTMMFFELSLFLYVIGLAVYLGCLTKGNIDPDSGEPDNRNIFILFLVFTTLCSLVYLLLDYLTDIEPLIGWDRLLKCYKGKHQFDTMRNDASDQTDFCRQNSINGQNIDIKEESKRVCTGSCCRKESCICNDTPGKQCN